ncbi:hypothetical protein SVIOM342S_02189 [Streptomyces violaceorubidus]
MTIIATPLCRPRPATAPLLAWLYSFCGKPRIPEITLSPRTLAWRSACWAFGGHQAFSLPALRPTRSGTWALSPAAQM